MKQEAAAVDAMTLDDLETLIENGKWRRALRIARTSAFELEHMKTSRYWFLRTLTELLVGKADMLTYCLRRANSCPDYVPWIEGDFLRDHALFLIRAGRHAEAAACLVKAARHHTSQDRIAVFTMCIGALANSVGQFESALGFFQDANDLWHDLKLRNEPATDQWIKNNRFRLLKVQARLGHMDSELYEKIRKYDPSRIRRIRARLIWQLGMPASALDDWIVRTFTKLNQG